MKRDRKGHGLGVGPAKLTLSTLNGHGATKTWQDLGYLRSTLDLGGREEITSPYEESAIVHAALKVLASAVSSVPLRFYLDADPDSDPLPDDHELVRLFERPNAYMDAATFQQAALLHRKLDGEDFWFLRDANGKPAAPGKLPLAIQPVRGSLIQSTDNDNGLPKSWWYQSKSGGKVEFPAESVIQLRDYDPTNPIRGIGDVDALARSLQSQFQAERYQTAILRNSGDPGGFIKTKANIQQPEKDRLSQEAREAFGNADAAGEWKVIGADEEYVPNKMSPKDMQYRELLLYERDRVLWVLGVPPPCVGIFDDATYNNITEAKRALWTGGNGVTSYLRTVESAINAWLRFGLREEIVARFDLSSVDALQDDTTAKVLAAAQVVQSGIGVPWNEAAAALNIKQETPPVNGDVRFVSAALQVQSDEADSDVQILNGAQLTQAVAIVAQVAAGEIPRDSGVAMLETLFGLTAEVAERIMGSAGTGSLTMPNVNPSTPEPVVDEVKVATPDSEGKSLSGVVTRDAAADRRAYYKRFEDSVLTPNDEAIKKAARRFLTQYRSAQKKRIEQFAASGEKALRLRSVDAEPVAKKLENENEINDLLLNREEWNKKFEKIIRPALEESWARALADGGGILDVNDPQVIQALNRQTIKLVEGVNGRLAESIRQALIETMAETATSVTDMQQAIRDLLPELDGTLAKAFGDIDARARAIARTESGHAATNATVEQMKSEGSEMVEWVAEMDDATRPSHAANDGMVVAMGTAFPNGMRWPHDENASADEVVNCRCLIRPALES